MLYWREPVVAPGASERMSFIVIPAFFMAVLACWLGLSLLVRAPRDRPTQAFAWLCLHLTVYGLTIVLPDLTDAAAVRRVLELIQLIETLLLPPVFFHFIMVLVADGPAPWWQYVALIAGYVSGLALTGYALLGEMTVRPDGVLFFLYIIWSTTNRPSNTLLTRLPEHVVGLPVRLSSSRPLRDDRRINILRRFARTRYPDRLALRDQ